MKPAAPAADLCDKARDMLRGQHSVRHTAAHLRLPPATVEALAKALHAAKAIPRVRME